MRSFVTAVVAAIEAVAVALAGLVVIAVPAVLLWVVTFGLAAEPATVAAGVAGSWLLAHFVPLGFTLSAESALALGLAPEALQFTLSLAPLGITLLTVFLALRAGWRFAARGGVGAMGALGGFVGFGAVALLAAGVAGDFVVWPRPLAAVVPAAVYGIASAVAFLVRAGVEQHAWWQAAIKRVQQGLGSLGVRGAAAFPARLGDTLRLAAAACALLVGLAAIGFAVAVVTAYAEVTAVTQSLQLDPLGSLLLFLAQLALVPIAIVWSLAWLAGPGFSIGIGSSVTPFETLLGPLPSLPIFGVIPDAWGGPGALAPAIVVLSAIALGVIAARRPTLRRASWAVALATAACAAVLVGLAVAGACVLASGAVGPDRLAEAGSDGWIVGGFVALEVGIGLLLGVAAGRVDMEQLNTRLRAQGVDADTMPGAEAMRRFRSMRRARTLEASRALGGDSLGVAGGGWSGGAADDTQPVSRDVAELTDFDEADHESRFDDAVGTGEHPVIRDDFETVELAPTEDQSTEAPERFSDIAEPVLDRWDAARKRAAQGESPEPERSGTGWFRRWRSDPHPEAPHDASLADEPSSDDVLHAFGWDSRPEEETPRAGDESPAPGHDARDDSEDGERPGWRWPRRGR
ncbi:cell division protein PerM [Leucobacter sp. USHLN153]|uniref:cell division protein PerM n=1 Tax=Leucobacter sp. USHLN153 TaxID=3081268 RepID=UPI00301645BB